MTARRVLYCILSALSLPWCLLEAVEQHRMVTTQNTDAPPHLFALAAIMQMILVASIPFVIAAIVLSRHLWRTSPRTVRVQVASWLAVLLLSFCAAFLNPWDMGLSSTRVAARILIGWRDLTFSTALFVLPIAFLASSFLRPSRAAGIDAATAPPP